MTPFSALVSLPADPGPAPAATEYYGAAAVQQFHTYVSYEDFVAQHPDVDPTTILPDYRFAPKDWWDSRYAGVSPDDEDTVTYLCVLKNKTTGLWEARNILMTQYEAGRLNLAPHMDVAIAVNANEIGSAKDLFNQWRNRPWRACPIRALLPDEQLVNASISTNTWMIRSLSQQIVKQQAEGGFTAEDRKTLQAIATRLGVA